MKKKPERSCVGCREKKDKDALIRIVHTPDGTYAVDRTGRMNGRGAYLCDNPECLQKAVKNHGLERSFHGKVDERVMEILKEEIGNGT